MDILGSIMKKMEKPPALGEKERQIKKLQQEVQRKEQAENEKRRKEFRATIVDEIQKFMEDESRTRHTFAPMNKACRSTIYTLAEDAQLIVHSFGREEEDRHVMVFKENDIPCEAEIFALRRGEPYIVPSADVLETQCGESDDVPTSSPINRRNRQKHPPEYLQKYQKHLGDLDYSKDAAIKAQAENRSYGFVSSEQKRDKRTIEQTLADIQKRKKQKCDDDVTIDSDFNAN